MSVNYPWYTYPNIVSSPYKNFEDYRRETTRLFDFIKHLSTSHISGTLLHLTIGAAMEEYLNQCATDRAEFISIKNYQWRQLFPFWLQLYIESNPTSPVEIIIVSPNKQFGDEMFYTPLLFINETQHEMQWQQKTKLEYFSSKYPNVHVNVFYTFFPHQCHKNNKTIQWYTNRTIPLDSCVENIINECTQKRVDVDFIKEFYNELENLFQTITKTNGGFVSCYSFAVFNTYTSNSSVCNYAMFAKVLSILKEILPDNRFAYEWYYSETCYCMIDVLGSGNIHTYIKPIDKMKDGFFPVFSILDEKLAAYDIPAESLCSDSCSSSDDNSRSSPNDNP